MIGRLRQRPSSPRPDPAPMAATRRALGAAAAHADPQRRFVALQLREFDKGGLEEVVLTLARHLPSEFAPVVLDTSGKGGHLAEVAAAEGIAVVPLHDDPAALGAVLDSLDIAVASLHYDTFGAEVYRRRGIPVVYTIHNTYIWATPEFRSARQAAYACVDRFVAVSDAVADFFAARIGVPRHEVEVIPNGLALDALARETPVARSELGLAPQTTVFLNVASFNWNKFHVLMLAAMERLRAAGADAHLLLLGNVHDVGCHEFVAAEIERRSLQSCVTMLEYVAKDRVVGLMRMADCFLLPSLIEGCSMAALEAHWAGMPLILSDVGAASMLLGDGEAGILVPNACPDLQQLTPEDVVTRYNRGLTMPNLDAVVAAMAAICADRDGWRRRAGIGRQRVEAEFSAAKMCQRYGRLFEDLVRA